MNRTFQIILMSAVGAGAADLPADSARGAGLFETLSCIQCHSVSGRGGKIAPDLGRMVDRNFTPASLAATMWNHAPAMWNAMRERDIRVGDLDEQAARDLFAYFYSARFFEKPGDAARGKRAFAERGCTKCHGLTEPVRPMIKPVKQWVDFSNPNALAEAMWNHRAYMLDQADADRVRWPELSAQDLTDMLVYLRNLPSPPSRPATFLIGAGQDGVAVFNAKGCAVCHTPGSNYLSRIKGETLTAIAAEMWNHAPRMAAAGAKPVSFAPGEMQDVLGYLWARQFFEDSGKPSAGRRTFEKKRCTVCHQDATSGAPNLPGAQRSFGSAAMVAALWHHGPRMLDQMKAKNVSWPRFEGSQMSDLLAYLSSGNKP